MKNKQSFMTFLFGLLCLVILHASCSETRTDEIQYAHEKTSPFSAIRFEQGLVLVEVENEWFRLEAMDTISISYLIAYCKAIYGYEYKKRFSEDFVEFLNEINIRPKEIEDFTLIDKKQEKHVIALRFMRGKRNAAQAFYRKHYQKATNLTRVLTKEQMKEDLDELHEALTHNYSYYFLNNVDIKKEIQKLKDALPEEATSKEFGIFLQPFIHQFGDAHSKVRGLDLKSYGTLPFETSAFEGKVICHIDTQLVEQNYPFLKSINGTDIEKLKALNEYWLVSNASPQYVKRRIASRLEYMGFLLERFGKYDKALKVELVNELGETITKDFELMLPDTYVTVTSSSARISPFQHKVLKGNIGYLKIESMEDDYEEELVSVMEEMQSTQGLIIDVRDNGGGKRNILLELIPYFIHPDQSPIIGNLAVYRTNLRNDLKEGFLSNRFLYPVSSSQFDEDDKNDIIAFKSTFQPSVQLNENKYSSYHYLLLKSDENKPFYDKPVAVLMNEGCFSATDIFLSSFNQLDNVELIGTKSGGGSGRTSKLQLTNSTLEVKLSTIVSFQPDGSLYDRVGVSPDTEAYQIRIDDVIGKRDNQLDIAIKYVYNTMHNAHSH